MITQKNKKIMKLSDLRIGDIVVYINNYKLVKVEQIDENGLTISNGQTVPEQEIDAKIAPCDIDKDTLKRFRSTFIPLIDDKKCSDTDWILNEQGCSFKLHYNKCLTKAEDNEELGNIEILDDSSCAPYCGTWTLECSCNHRLDNDPQTYQGIVSIQELQHLIHDYFSRD